SGVFTATSTGKKYHQPVLRISPRKKAACPLVLWYIAKLTPSKSSGAGRLMFHAFTLPKENPYTAQIASAPVSTAIAAGQARALAAATTPSTPGRSTIRYARKAKNAAAGRNPNAVNLLTTASAVAAPSHRLCCQVGSSAHHSSAKKAAERQAVSGMSVVATPACASTVGTSVNRPVASTATARPKCR